jgi:Pyridoxamine 5'-phosphate oxidase
MSSARCPGQSHMSEPTAVTNLDIYGSEALPWSRARDLLPTSLTKMETPVFLGTVSPNGRPHAAGIGAAWHDGEIYFTSGPGTRKSRDLAANPACTISIRLPGIDLTLEGDAHRVTDTETIEQLAAHYAAEGWPAESDGEGGLTAPFSAPSAGPPPWHLYRVTLRTAVGVANAEPYGATKWTFS